MNPEVVKLCEAARNAGGRAMLVGGSVRDQLSGIESKDFDIEVYGLQPERLRSVLEQIGHVNTVGEHFSVYKLVFYRSAVKPSCGSQTPAAGAIERFEIDVSLPRRESKSGSGHRGFVIEGDPNMSFEEAARRRDFTINSILCDPLTGEIVDPYGGQADLVRRVLRVVNPNTFIEDSLRVLRAVQLAARFAMTVEAGTAELCREIDLSDLPKERVWGEIEKLLTLAARPSLGLQVALELAVLRKLFPEIGALAGRKGQIGSDSEVDLFEHTKRSLDEAVKLSVEFQKPQRIAVMLATFCHSINHLSTVEKRFNEQTPGAVLNNLGVHRLEGYDVRSQVLALVREQSKPQEFHQSVAATPGDFRRLAARVDLDLLHALSKSCVLAERATSTAEDWFIARARELGVEHRPPAPLLQGRHLLEAGIEPGPRMGELLREVYELQLDDKVTTVEEALSAALRIRRPA